MKKDSKIYIAGHTGLIGSAILRQLQKKGYRNLIYKTHSQLDLTDKEKTERFFKKEKPHYIFLCAAKVGGIQANTNYPADFIYQNLSIQTNIIHLSYKYKIKKLLFLASACIYPKNSPNPIKEEYLMNGPIEPTNEPYAIAKIAGIKMCQAYNKQYGTNFVTVIPASVYGINDCFTEDGHVVAALIKKFHEAVKSNAGFVKIWGSGKPKREFIYCDDVANACILVMNNYDNKDIVNIGNGFNISILQLARLIKKVIMFKGEIITDKTKNDGNLNRLLDNNKIKKLKWKPVISLKEGLKFTCNWYMNPDT